MSRTMTYSLTFATDPERKFALPGGGAGFVAGSVEALFVRSCAEESFALIEAAHYCQAIVARHLALSALTMFAGSGKNRFDGPE